MKKFAVYSIVLLVISAISSVTFGEITFRKLENLEPVARESVTVPVYAVYPFEVDSSFWFGGNSAQNAQNLTEFILQRHFEVPVVTNKVSPAQSYLRWENGQWIDTRYERPGANLIVTGYVRLIKHNRYQETGIGVIIPGHNAILNWLAEIGVDEWFDQKQTSGGIGNAYKWQKREWAVDSLSHTTDVILVEVILKIIDVQSQIIVKEVRGVGSSKTKIAWNYGPTSGYNYAQNAAANNAVVDGVALCMAQLFVDTGLADQPQQETKLTKKEKRRAEREARKAEKKAQREARKTKG